MTTPNVNEIARSITFEPLNSPMHAPGIPRLIIDSSAEATFGQPGEFSSHQSIDDRDRFEISILSHLLLTVPPSLKSIPVAPRPANSEIGAIQNRLAPTITSLADQGSYSFQPPQFDFSRWHRSPQCDCASSAPADIAPLLSARPPHFVPLPGGN